MTTLKDRDLPPHIGEIVQSIALLHAEHHRKATTAERAVDRATGLVSRPSFLGVLGIGVILWVTSNVLLPLMGYPAFDGPPFPWLADILALLALIIAALIVMTQRRADKLAELRDQMTLELTLLTEQKTAKIIALIEEMRRDSPALRNRIDHEASIMATPTDAGAVMVAIEETDREIRQTVVPAPVQPRDTAPAQ